ncbi:hypothetical protein [Actinopolymorpha alba]|uniref:hypothetical protein n=1 Tax=Actinopolymorpha alba TaxID=533267 RepID=UPI000371571B|nr:hypothetical protein [Actinopolymorpha alba]
MTGVPREEISPDDLERVRQAAEEHFRQYFDGSLRSMRVVLTTYHAARTAIQRMPGAPELPPDPRPVYLVVVEGEFLRRPDQRSGTWLAIYVTPAFQARGHSGPASPGHPIPDRVINLDLNQLGRVYQIAP